MRDLSIDCLKGFAIFLVVSGHILQGSLIDCDHNFVYRVIYSFHMPLFFFLSGYVSFLSGQVNFTILRKRFLSLIIPFFMWAILAFYYRHNSPGNIIQYLWHITCVPDDGLWFLWILFFCYALFLILRYLPFKLEVSLLITALAVVAAATITKKNLFGIKLLGKEYPFFALGYILHKYKAFFIPIITRYWYCLFIPFVAGACFWMRVEPPLFYKYKVLLNEVLFCYNFIIGLLGTLSFFAVFQFIKNKQIVKVLSFVGSHTFAIYAIHFFLLNLLYWLNPAMPLYYLYVLCCAALIIATCLIIEFLVLKSSILAFLLLGNMKRLNSRKIN